MGHYASELGIYDDPPTPEERARRAETQRALLERERQRVLAAEDAVLELLRKQRGPLSASMIFAALFPEQPFTEGDLRDALWEGKRIRTDFVSSHIMVHEVARDESDETPVHEPIDGV